MVVIVVFLVLYLSFVFILGFLFWENWFSVFIVFDFFIFLNVDFSIKRDLLKYRKNGLILKFKKYLCFVIK